MNHITNRWGFWVIAVAVTTVFAFVISQRSGNWLILGIGVPLAVAITVLLMVFPRYNDESVNKDGARDE